MVIKSLISCSLTEISVLGRVGMKICGCMNHLLAKFVKNQDGFTRELKPCLFIDSQNPPGDFITSMASIDLYSNKGQTSNKGQAPLYPQRVFDDCMR